MRFIHLHLFFLFWSLLSTDQAWASALYCADLLSDEIELTIGDSVRVEHYINGKKRDLGRLILIGESLSEDLSTELLVFASESRAVFFIDKAKAFINGKSSSEYDFSYERLPRLMRQIEGSCNLCANISAINQIALDNFVEPINLTVEEIEASKTAELFSGHSSFRVFLRQI